MAPDEPPTPVALTNLNDIAGLLLASLEPENQTSPESLQRLPLVDEHLEQEATTLWQQFDIGRLTLDERTRADLEARQGRWGVETIVSLVLWVMGQKEISAYRQMEADLGADVVERLTADRFAKIWQAYDPGDSENYHRWQNLLWSALERLQEHLRKFKEDRTPAPELQALFEIGNSLLYFKLREAFATRSFSVGPGDQWPEANLTSESRTLKAFARLTPDQSDDPAEDLPHWQSRIGAYVMEMDDLTADVFDILTGVWLQQARTPETLITITANDFLRLRGLKAQKSGTGRRGGYKEEWRRLIARHIGILASTWVRVIDMEVVQPSEGEGLPERRMVRWAGESRAVVLTSREGLLTPEGLLNASRWRLRPGDVFARFLFGAGRQTALLASQALAYDPEKERWEKRLTRYFSWQWRIRQGRGAYLNPFLVSTLLTATGVEIDTRNPGRTRNRLEKALDRLHTDGVLTGWQYSDDTGAAVDLQRGWWRRWLNAKVLIEPPQPIMDRYARIRSREPHPPALPPSAALTDQLKSERLRRGLTQLQAAEQIGISQSLLSGVERGVSRPLATSTLRKIKKWLGQNP